MPKIDPYLSVLTYLQGDVFASFTNFFNTSLWHICTSLANLYSGPTSKNAIYNSEIYKQID